MKLVPSPFVAAFALNVAIVPVALAQNAAPDVSKYFAARAPRMEGTVTLVEGDVSAAATLQIEASNARLEIGAQEASGTPARTVVASGQQTMTIDGATKRTRLWHWNAWAQPWRSQSIDAGGPANFWMGGVDVTALQRAYTISESSKGNERTLELKARPQIGRYLVRDEIRAGGKGSGKFYAARKRWVWDRPTRIVLSVDAKTSAPLSREEFDGRDRLQSRTSFQNDAQGRPQAATTRDFNGHLLAQWSYNWQPRTAAFEAATFEIAAPAGQISEEAEVQGTDKLRGEDASSRWNLGTAQARLENVSAAFAAWDEAAQQAPQAVAPWMSSFDLALQIRDANRAATSLQKLTALLGENHLEILSRRVRLAALRRDAPTMKAALDAAVAAQPTNLTLRLRRAGYERAFGDAAVATRDLTTILSNAKVPAAIGVDAAVLMAVFDSPTNTTANDAANPWPGLAALLKQIEGGAAIDANELQSTLGRLPNERARAAVGIALEKAGRFDDALAVWTGIATTAPEPLWLEAQRHLMILAAQSGTPLDSLRAYRDISARLEGEPAQRALQDALIAAWDKSLGRDKLRVALQNRATSTAASDDDARLWLAWLETYGSDDDINTQTKVAVSRWPRSAWWQSRWAEILTNAAQHQPPGDTGGGRTRAYNEALKAVDRAIALDTQQPYYAMQKSLIATSRAVEKVAVSDAGTRVAEREAALQNITDLGARWPNDGDARLSVAIQQLALNTGADVAAATETLQSVLADGRTFSPLEADAHPVLFTARLSLAAALRRAGQIGASAAQYAQLLLLSRTPAEYSGVALNTLNFLDSQHDAEAVAALMTRIVSEPWPFGDEQELMSQWVNALAPRRLLMVAVRQSLAQMKSPGARLAADYLDFAFLRLAQSATAGGEAPIAVQATLRDATVNWKSASADLQQLAAADDATLAAQAASLMAQDALARGDAAVAAAAFERALALAPTDLDLRISLVRALADSKQNDKVLSLRDESLRMLAPSPNTWRWAAWMSGRGGDNTGALRLARNAFNAATSDAATGVGAWRDAAFILARALAASGSFAASDALYEKLADKQWSPFERACALLDWQERADANGRDEAKTQATTQLQTIKVSAADLKSAQAFVRALD